MKKRAIEWTDAHKWEALARLHELYVEIVRKHTGATRAMSLDGIADERRFREALQGAYVCGAAGHPFDPARIDREVRRVRALAEGRLVREAAHVEWRVMSGRTVAVRWYESGAPEGVHLDGPKAEERARAYVAEHSARYPEFRAVRVHVTRIRRAR